MPRFVLLRHECPPDYPKPSHWDLMLEQGNSLATWELRELPIRWARQLGIEQDPPTTDTVAAIRLPDHRLAYLDYEGPLEGDRGEVWQCDHGDCQILVQQENTFVVLLSGTILTGQAKLSRSASDRQLDTLSISPKPQP